MFRKTIPAALASMILFLPGPRSHGKETAAAEPPVELLWPGGAPHAKGNSPADRPWLDVYLPSTSGTRAAVVVVPGGGYGMLALDHEGLQIARWLNSAGIAAFVLHYRLAPYRHPVPLLDAKRALRLVRSRAPEWKIDPARVGIIGFSAGGHLASTLATHFDEGAPDAADPIDRVSCRPDFVILGYPVITFTRPVGHQGSMKNLLGERPDPQLVEELSNEKHVTARTPPTFLMHADDDKGVPVENSIMFYEALRRAGVPAELHVFQKGDHGFGLTDRVRKDPSLSLWPELCIAWLRVNGFIPEARIQP